MTLEKKNKMERIFYVWKLVIFILYIVYIFLNIFYPSINKYKISAILALGLVLPYLIVSFIFYKIFNKKSERKQPDKSHGAKTATEPKQNTAK
jgi:amino acid permease